MKKLVTLSTVAGLHLAVISMIFIQPGCGSSEQPTESMTAATSTDEATQINSDIVPADFNAAPASNANTVATVEEPEAIKPPEGSNALRDTPTRPNSTWNMHGKKGQELVAVKSDDGQIEPVAPAASTKPAEVKSAFADTASLPTTIYKVQKGDSLSIIAKKHKVSLDSLLNANSLDKNSILKIGQEIKVPAAKLVTSNTSPVSATAPVASTSALNDSVAENAEIYVVQKGDSLSKIASKKSTTVAQIKALNNLKNDNIILGQKLTLPKSGATAPASETTSKTVAASTTTAGANETIHEVKSGETLGGIAKKYGTSVAKISERNSITDPRKLRLGQKIIVPSAKTSTVADAASSTQPKATEATTAPAQSTVTAPAQTAPVQQAPITVENTTIPAQSTTTAPSDVIEIQ